MPEAAELETLRYQLGAELPLTIGDVSVRHPRAVRAHDSSSMQLLDGETIHTVARHGKWLALETTRHRVAIHLRMSGRLHLVERTAPLEPHTHVTFDVEGRDGAPRSLRFVDPRTFGEIRLLEVGGRCWPDAPDVLDAPTFEQLTKHQRHTTRSIKAVLLDQAALVAGVGNYLADEICHAAGVRPARATNRLTRAEWRLLLQAIGERVTAHAAARGTALADEGWKDLDGRLGAGANELRVHARARCGSCGTDVTRSKLNGRSTYFCRRCQR